MDAQVKANWLEDLRSGRFSQCTSSLQDQDGGFCCLGVLASRFAESWASDPAGTRMVPVRGGASLAAAGDLSKHGMSGYLSDSFSAEVGLNEEDQRAVARMNDTGKSFAEIADYIEAKL